MQHAELSWSIFVACAVCAAEDRIDRCRTLIDEKIALREAPGDLQRLTATLLDADWAAAEAVEQSVQQAVLSAGSQAVRFISTA